MNNKISENYFSFYLEADHIYRNIAMNMGTTKSGAFTVKENSLARLARALGHPARIAILTYLLENNSCVCGDIVDHLPLSQSTVSQHLKELKSAGLIKGDIDGVKVCYCIDDKEWEKARAALVAFLNIVPACKC